MEMDLEKQDLDMHCQKKSSETPLVSICCITFNHENYIREALDGFLMQKTSFPVEIIVHDDASTDGTSEIIKEYVKKHPERFVPILQSENQWAKGIRISPTCVWPKARGKYIALCEGDDYWTDPLKLQKQVDFLEANPEYTMCTHSHIEFNCKTLKKKHVSKIKKTGQVSKQQVLLKDGSLMATASYVFRRNLLNPVPKFLIEAPFGDYFLTLLCINDGYIHFIDDPMCVYRREIPDSWTSNKRSPKALEKMLNRQNSTLNLFNEYSKGKYHKIIKKVKRKRRGAYIQNVATQNRIYAIKLLLSHIFEIDMKTSLVILKKIFVRKAWRQ